MLYLPYLVICSLTWLFSTGYIEGTGHSVGDNASLICEIGFVPSDVDHITCTKEGEDKLKHTLQNSLKLPNDS